VLAGASISHLYKNNEAPNSPNEKIDDPNDMSGRYSVLSMARPKNRRSIDPTRERKAYKYSRIDDSKIGHIAFYVQKEKCAINSSQNGQHGCPQIPSENEQNKIFIILF